MRIRFKILTSIVAIVALTVLAATLIGRTVGMSIVEDQASDHLLTTAQSRAQHIETTLEHYTNKIELFAEQVHLYRTVLGGVFAPGKGNNDTVSTVLAGMTVTDPEIDTVLIVDETGEIEVTSDDDRFPLGMNVGATGIFTKGQQGTYIGASDLPGIGESFVLCTAAPFPTAWDPAAPEHKPSGVVIFEGGQDRLFRITTDSTGLGKTGEVYIVDAQGRMVTPSRFSQDAVLKQHVDLPPAIRASLSSDSANEGKDAWEVISSVNYEGSKVMGVYHQLPAAEWTLAVEKGSNEVFSPVSRLTSAMMWVLVGVLVLGVGLALLLSRTMSKPIERLHKGAEAIISGNWDHDLSTTAKDEIGELSRAFSRMTANLRQKTDALRDSEHKFRTIFERANDEIVYLDKQGTILDVNKKIEEMLGYKPEEVIGRNFADIGTMMTDDDRSSMDRAIGRATVKPGAQGMYELELHHKDGNPVYVEANVTTVERDGKLEKILAVVRDITERKQIEEEKAQAYDRLEAALRDLETSQEQLLQSAKLAAIGELVAGVAHDLANPLTSILLHSELLREENNGNVHESAQAITRHAERAVGIIDNLLGFARKHGPQKSAISVNDIVRSTVELRNYELRKAKIRTNLDLDPDLPTTMADANQLQQVFFNLMGNAEQAMHEAHGQGHLTIRTNRKTDNTIQVQFEDDGPGMPQEVMERIFEPFFTTKENGKGTGLGLSICKGIVDRHSGRIHVESTLGQGTTFTIEIPITAEENIAASPNREKHNPLPQLPQF